MEQQNKFPQVFLHSAGPSPELLMTFALGLLVVGMMGNLVYDVLIAPTESLPAAWRPLVAMLLFTALAYLLYLRDRRRERSVQVAIDERRLAPPHKGLIWLLGPGKIDHLQSALEHHLKGGGGQHCWLVMQEGAGPVQDAFNQLSQWLIAEGHSSTKLYPVYIPKLDVREAYQAVRAIFEREAAEEGLSANQVIADITGGTKLLTAGMVLAALTVGGALEYVESERNKDGQPIPGTQRVVLVDTTFYVGWEEQQ